MAQASRVLRRGSRYFTEAAARRVADFLNVEECADDVQWDVEPTTRRGAQVYQIVAYDVGEAAQYNDD